MTELRVLFFGSTNDSLIVLDALLLAPSTHYKLTIAAVVTQPARPVGRKQIVTPTPVESWANKHHVAVLSFPSNSQEPWLFAEEKTVRDTLQPVGANLLISASFGQKIPIETIQEATYGGLNVHPSLLPRWRGADPVPWAILTGDHQTGVSVITLAKELDEGHIIAQKKVPISPTDFSDPLRAKLFTLGAHLLVDILPDYVSGKIQGNPQRASDTPWAKRFTRDDGFEPWDKIQESLQNSQEAIRIDRKFRALTPWPGLWTTVILHGEEKRLKILALHLTETTTVLDEVQLEGKGPVAFSQFQKAYLT